MKIMLLKNDKFLGQVGDVLVVKDGYAWNYLIPNGIAVSYNSPDRVRLESQIQKLAAKEAQETTYLEGILAKITQNPIIVVKETHDDGQLYGGINEADIIRHIGDVEFTLSKSMIVLDPIHKVGQYTVEIHLSRNIQGTLALTVKSENQTDSQIAAASEEAIALA